MKQYKVTGMSCAACQSRVEKAVGKVPGVTSVAVSLLTNSMGVEGDADPSAVIEAVEKAGYGASLKSSSDPARKAPASEAPSLKDEETPKLVRRLILSAGFLLILMYVSMGHNMWNFPLPSYFDHNHLGLTLTQMVLALIVMYINRKFFESGIKSLLHGAPNMDTLVALGSGVSFLWSLFVFFRMCGMITNGTANSELHDLYHNQLYFESAAMIPALITVGKTLESLSKGRTTNALKSLMDLAPKTARVLRSEASGEESASAENEKEVTVPIEEVAVGDIFIVKPGESIPVDGVVIEGESAVDESALTGESIPVDKAVGSKVSAATINRSGYMKCRATRVGEDTTLSQIIQMVSDAAATKAPIARIADKVSGIFVPAVIGIAALVIAAWLIAGQQASFALARGISVLVISCPCALGLATPVAIMVGNGLGAKNGVLFKTSEALETLGKATVVALDKTGTITSGEPRVTSILPAEGVTKEYLLQKAYTLEKRSEHPLAKAIVNEFEGPAAEASAADESSDSGNAAAFASIENENSACATGSCDLYMVENFSIRSGNGLEGTISGKLVHGGSGKFIREFTAFPKEIIEAEEKCASSGETPLFFEEDGKLLGMIAVADTMKEDSAEGIRQLKNLGLKVVMLTGDNEKTAEAIGAKADADKVVAGVMPEEKGAVIQTLQSAKDQAGKPVKVIMVGDGINDAPALTTADIGMAIGAGTDVAIESADVVLMNSTLTDVAAAIRLSRKTVKNIHENLFWAFFYNLICIPVAAGILSWKMNPMIGAAAMSISSFTVCMNALRLNLFNMHDSAHDKPLHGTSPEEITIPETEKRSKSMKKTLKIEGMMCGHCEASVKKALEELPFIANASPNHNTNSCEIEISDDAAYDESVVKATIEGKDYKYLGEA
ncbi:MAG: heavy metal translocating P-type ATPase [Clostridiales bacterium]|nr:heavy metal translocating P-type ATPase [Clostridiales bacterium]